MNVEGAAELERALVKFADDFLERFRSTGLRAVAEKHREQTRRRFTTKTDPLGRPWKKWSDSYAKTRGAQHSLLVSSGDLLKSLGDGSIRKDGHDLEFGSDVPYAKSVQETATGEDKRPYLGIGKQSDIDELQATLDRWMGRTLKVYGLA